MGDSGRYYAHMRYLLEGFEIEGPQWVVVVKDGINGLGSGRIVWSRPSANFGRRGKLQELDELDEIMVNQMPVMMSRTSEDLVDEILGVKEAEA